MQCGKRSGWQLIRATLLAAAVATIGACGGGGGGSTVTAAGDSGVTGVSTPGGNTTGGNTTGASTNDGSTTGGGTDTTTPGGSSAGGSETGALPPAPPSPIITATPRLRADEFRIGGSGTQLGAPVVARLQGGDFVMAWESGTSTEQEIVLQRIDATGNPTGPAARVDTPPGPEVYPYYVTTPSVAALADGGYIVVWSSFNSTDWDVHAQRFNSTGSRVGGQRVINSVTGEGVSGMQFQGRQSVAALDDGGYVVMWTSRPTPAGFDLSIAQMARFDASDRVVLAGLAEAGGSGPDVFEDTATVALYSGGYVMAWSISDMVTQMRLDAGNVPRGGKTAVGSGTGSVMPRMAALWDGGWIVTIINGATIYAHRFDSAGNRVGEPVRVNTAAAAESSSAPAVGLPDGGYVVTWQASTSSGNDIYAQRFNAQGQKVGDEILVNTTTAGAQTAPDITGDNLGGFIVTWLTLDGTQRGVYARGFVPTP